MKAYPLIILLALTILASGCAPHIIGCIPHIIGGDRDEHGCLIAAGYSWCDTKQKCIRIFGENCTENATAQIANPASVNCINNGGQLEIVTADDGSQTGICTFKDGTICEEWAYFRGECFEGLYSCTSDADCMPKPGCHPHECINSAYAGNFTQPDACTMMFDCSAAYQNSDCACINHMCTNKNLNNKGCTETAGQ